MAEEEIEIDIRDYINPRLAKAVQNSVNGHSMFEVAVTLLYVIAINSRIVRGKERDEDTRGVIRDFVDPCFSFAEDCVKHGLLSALTSETKQ